MQSAYPVELAFTQYLKGEVIPSLTTLAKEVKWGIWVQLLILLHSVTPLLVICEVSLSFVFCQAD